MGDFGVEEGFWIGEGNFGGGGLGWEFWSIGRILGWGILE